MKASTEVFMRNQMSNATRRERVSHIEGIIVGAKLILNTKDAAELDAKLESYRKEIERLNKQLGY